MQVKEVTGKEKPCVPPGCTMLRVHVPPATPTHPKFKDWGGGYGHWLREGFRRVGVEMVRDESLAGDAQQCPVPMLLVARHDATEVRRPIYWDYQDSEDKLAVALIQKHEDALLFKVQYSIERCHGFRRVVPCPIGSLYTHQYLDELQYLRALREECWKTGK